MAKDLRVAGDDGGKRPPKLSIDWELYEQYLEGSNLSDEQKRELIEALWYIVMSFVDLGFNLDPVQQVQSLKAQDLKGGKLLEARLIDGIHSVNEGETKGIEQQKGEADEI